MPEGTITAAHGRHYLVQASAGSSDPRLCYTRGKKTGLAVGDLVEFSPLDNNAGVINRVYPRKNLFYRSDATRSKLFAANISQMLLVLAPQPEFSDELAWRVLLAAHSADVPALILLNKADLPDIELARARLANMPGLGVAVHEISALDSAATRAMLLPLLSGQRSLLLGQSAMGKSTLLNALVPSAQVHTQEHSQALGTGRHTTTQTNMYSLRDASGKVIGEIIDSPGFQTFGLQHLSQTELAHGLREFVPFLSACRFYNCTHLHEPGCAVLQAVAAGQINPKRHAFYARIIAENQAAKAY